MRLKNKPMQTEARETTSQKVETALKEQGRNKRWLARQLDISTATLYSRLEHNDWSLPELLVIKTALNIE